MLNQDVIADSVLCDTSFMPYLKFTHVIRTNNTKFIHR